MIHRSQRKWIGTSSVILAGVSMTLAGCTVQVQPEHEHVYAPPPQYAPPPPAPAEAAAPAPYEAPPADVEATYNADLSPYGSWVTVGTYGRCWRPNGVAVGWQPYTVGHWVETDQGWAWVSDPAEANWGVVTYHYGRWYQAPSYGWVWVPGTTWGPAWVAWRSGGGYCGWAPLPPQCGFGPTVSVAVVDRYCPPSHYVCIDERYMGEPVIYNHVIRNNVTIVNRTTNITNITVVNNRVVNRGVSVTEVERVSGRRIERQQFATATSADEARRLRAEGKPVAYQPQNIQRADEAYRQRVEARTTEEHAQERTRSTARTTEEQNAERQRVQRRATESQQATEAERQREANRTQESAQSTEAQKQRAADRAKETAQATEAEKQRAAERAKSTAQEDQSAKQRTAERDKAAAQEDQSAKQRTAERDKAAAQEDQSAKQRAADRNQQASSDRQAAHDRAVAREKAAQSDKAAPTDKSRDNKSDEKDDQQR